MHVAYAFIVVLGLLLPATEVHPESTRHAAVVAGWVENVTLLPWGETTKAKLDTGARTSSIHAENVARFKRDGTKWVRFELVLKTPPGKTRRIKAERPLVRRIAVKEHEHDNDSRLVVSLDFCLNGRPRNAEFSLADRSKFVYSVLLGRQFLAGTTLIDPAQTFLTKAGCDASAKGQP